jgi:hypothetical protein
MRGVSQCFDCGNAIVFDPGDLVWVLAKGHQPHGRSLVVCRKSPTNRHRSRGDLDVVTSRPR